MSEFDLTPAEVEIVRNDMRGMIEASDTIAEVKRPLVANEGEFDGPVEEDTTAVASINIEFVTDADAPVLYEGSDGLANCLPDADVTKRDILIVTRPGGIEPETFRVRHVQPLQLGAIVTHKRLELKRVQGEAEEGG
ncbi:hypothetical protein K8I61_17290 [bacterium]|nr:hypothetical protein [bacterium]